MAEITACRIGGCTGRIAIKKWRLCRPHYTRFYLHGDPLWQSGDPPSHDQFQARRYGFEPVRANSTDRAALARARSGRTVIRLAIFERDKWICQLCGVRVDRTVDSEHASAPSLDHVIPMARGGRHEPDNVQCAHRGCNTKKGASLRSGFDPLAQWWTRDLVEPSGPADV